MLSVRRGPTVEGLMRALALASMVLAASPAMSHSWYPWECCSDKDCEALPPDSVRIMPNGYFLPNGETIAFRDVRMSPDRDFHWCRHAWARERVIQPAGGKVCLFAPMGGV
jgi:hypothetical protein